MRRLEQVGIVVLVAALVALPTAIHGWPTTVAGNLFTAALLASGLTVVWWRSHPRMVAVAGAALWLVPTLLSDYGWFPDTTFAILALVTLVAALGWSGRAAWVCAGVLAAYLFVLWLILGEGNEVPLIMFSLPSFLAGTVLRLHRESAEELARRGRELEEERDLFAELAVRHERARIASELHDIVGHAISVMVIQAAAGQRLVERDPVGTEKVFAGLAESARQGSDDLRRLVELLGGMEVGGPDLSLIDEVVTRAARSGLDVSCRFEGSRDGVSTPVAHAAFRVVQESLTNALRYAPGAAVRVVVNSTGRDLTVRVTNGTALRERPLLSGTGRGLAGLRERLQDLGGQLVAGPIAGGWQVEASLPDDGGRRRAGRSGPGRR
ncbi:signal transduction histidine kinase [Kribbella sp. VKM Ac-2571]|uniref:sensor histidine kinase n=1 Tax=Kribbella sp. VKM Ac-2571 TaxID=2512222 RepID=UPI00105ED79B|nr:histidine kinase [Kribbella sp. VKM Ac-2571]TDO67182.1 signal transduction histidine kinase [Kribbella sp. VKM Ac-2571]